MPGDTAYSICEIDDSDLDAKTVISFGADVRLVYNELTRDWKVSPRA